ncbi:MBL fold metallo-hydrolase [Pseudonocardia sp. HH130629-09]|uniref:MBL fold metallo-hydrolase n=1 Tax=Pseudonocardia sp. HH130629-09 TaxID=1641402 RepID=UPI000A539316|nr:MBL fold metallo-hydrolase [Pseudonocardia sp. HH130629-09]
MDPPLTAAQAESVVERVLAWRRELTTIYVTHAHGDHWFGSAALLEHFPTARVLALPEVAARARARTPEQVAAFWEPRFPGGQMPDKRVPPDPMEGRVLVLGGHELIAVPLGHTDTDGTSALHVPSLGLVVAGDAVYDDVHLYLAESDATGRAAWRAALRTIRDLEPRTVVAGHQRPGSTGDPSAIDATLAYLDDFEDLLDTSGSALELYHAMRTRHPDRINPGALWGSARAAFPTETRTRSSTPPSWTPPRPTSCSSAASCPGRSRGSAPSRPTASPTSRPSPSSPPSGAGRRWCR